MAESYAFVAPDELTRGLAKAPVAFVPVGALEYHGPHLPFGVDMLTAEGLCQRTAAVTGGVVLPSLFVSTGVLPLPNSVTFPIETVRMVIRAVLEELADGGFRVIVVFSGHGALDHLHVLREECERLMQARPEIRALTTMWNELTADLEGDIHDHGAKVETSYMMELWPGTVHLDRLSDQPEAEHVGVYAANPRFTASREWGRVLSARVVEALSERVGEMLGGSPADNWSDLRSLVNRLQAGDLEVVAQSGRVSREGLSFELYNPHAQSKYVTGISSVRLNGTAVDTSSGYLRNRSTGEGHTDRPVAELGPLHGFYVRRHQRMELGFPRMDVPAGRLDVAVVMQLAGVIEIGARGVLYTSSH